VTLQLRLLDVDRTPRRYHDAITASANAKGCMDVDTVKGCTEGMREPGGCYGECYAAKIAAVTVADVQRVARKYLDPEKIQIAAVGDAGKIKAVLEKYGAVEVYDSNGAPLPPGKS